MAQVKRDQHVAAVVLPVVDDVIDVVLDHPSQRLAVYGSFVAGEFNDYVVGATGTRTKGGLRERRLKSTP